MFLTNRGVTSRIAGIIWKSKVPLKIKFFLWQMVNDKLQVAGNQIKKAWKGDSKCCLCSCFESVDHVFFQCHLAKFVWSVIRDIFHLRSVPNTLNDFTSSWLLRKGHLPFRLIIFLFAGFAWALWTTKNKMAIDKKFLKATTDVIYIALSLLQRWSIRLKEKDQDQLLQVKDSITGWLKTFKPSNLQLSDVLEIQLGCSALRLCVF